MRKKHLQQRSAWSNIVEIKKNIYLFRYIPLQLNSRTDDVVVNRATPTLCSAIHAFINLLGFRQIREYCSDRTVKQTETDWAIYRIVI